MSNNTPPKFNFRDVSKWKVIDLPTTLIIAHKCSGGVNFAGCTKYDIIESMAKPHGYSTDAAKFVFLMDNAVTGIANLKEEYREKLGRIIQGLEVHWNSGDYNKDTLTPG